MINFNAAVWGGLLRREVVSICMFLFTADMIIGTVTPTLSLFAQSLGASLTLVGVLATGLGLARFSSSVVIGTMSDRRGRKSILKGGMVLMGVACLLYTLTPVSYALLLTNVLFGMSFVATLTIGLAYAADISTLRERSLVFGLATTSMGLGFAVGSLIGGRVAAISGYQTAYLVAFGMSLLGTLVIWRGVPHFERRPKIEGAKTPSVRQQLRVLLANPVILATCLGTVLSNLVFGGLVITFFPIYAYGVGITQAAIGSMFATRALASTLARLPAGILGTILPGRLVMLTALIISTIVAFLLSQFTSPTVLIVLLGGEGIAYGLYLTSGQATIAKYAAEGSRGVALGTYMASASVGDSIAPLFLGMVADALGIQSVFYIIGSLALFGLIFMARILTRDQLNRAGSALE
jgi:MFS family permease